MVNPPAARPKNKHKVGMQALLQTSGAVESTILCCLNRPVQLQVRTLSSQVRLDARTKLLNPKWYEGMMSSGYEGVREIQKRLTNTMGWSATSGQVSAF